MPKNIIPFSDMDPMIQNDFSNLLDDYQFYTEMERESLQSKREAAKKLLRLLIDNGVQGVDIDDYRVQLQTTTTHKLHKEKLLERGVSAEVILYATETSTSDPYLRVSSRKLTE